MAMTDTVQVRPYRPEDEGALLEVWNAALPADPLTAGGWRARVLLDPNFDPAGCPVAEVDGTVAGFLLSLTRRVPDAGAGLEPEAAWITAFGVAPGARGRGAGGALLDAALARLRELGCRRVTVAAYLPNYFTPGVDVAAYSDGVAFLERRGFRVASRPLSMRATLTGFRTPPAIAAVAARLADEGVTVRPANPADIVPVLDFAREHFSPDWRREAAGVCQDLFVGDPRQVGLLVATRDGNVLGYAQHRAERFGPFGVRPDQRGRGLGRVLLAGTLGAMLAKGYHAAWFLWTSDQAARLYAQCGFVEVRRFAILSRALED
jgi:GNAT superfamily N-acetyltransferase